MPAGKGSAISLMSGAHALATATDALQHWIRSQIAEKNRSARSLKQQAGFENRLTAS